ncbi:hypothetical protein K438DRAFT_1975723 [Mycena galopus ATCC 62051]|nr:hypothetical protein K438DRAFT_1975723 [Mycena galopus ATCC 62051]
MPMDAWDGDTDKMSVQDFLRAFYRDIKVSTSNADKAKAFKNYLAANSDADDWFQALPAATKLNMDLIDIAIEAQYLAEPTVEPTAAEFETDARRTGDGSVTSAADGGLNSNLGHARAPGTVWGSGSKTSACGTLSGDPESPPREVPALETVLENVLVTDTAMPVYLEKNWKWARKQRVIKEEEPPETAEDDLKWHFWIPWQIEVWVHGKVIRPKRPARRDSVGDSDDSPPREVPDLAHDAAEELPDTSAPETVYTVDELAEHLVRTAKESRVWEDLRTGPPANFTAYLVQVSADATSGATPAQYAVQEGSEEGFEQPEIQVGGDTSVFTGLTDPHNPKHVVAILDTVMIGPDLTNAQRSTVRDFIVEFADCYALSMKEVIPIPGAEHTMKHPRGRDL